MVRIEVRDEGKGMSPERLAEIRLRGGGVGISGIRERVRQFKGDIKIESTGAGTMVFAQVPIPKDSHRGGSESLQIAV
jgi:signal transduction histidine kinase